MAKMTVEEAKAYLKDEVGYSDEQLASLNATQLKKFADGVMRQSDYDAAMNASKAEIEKAQNDLASAQDRLTAEIAEWATLSRAEQGKATQQRADFEKAQQDVLRLQQVVERVATEAGLDPKKILAETPVTTPAVKPASLDGYVKADDLDRLVNERIGGFASGMLNLTPELMQISIEHQQLYGTPLDTREIVRELQTRASTKGNAKSLDPRVIWDDLHKVSAKRNEVDTAARAKEISEAEARGAAAARSEMMLPGSTAAPGHRSIVFGEKPRTSVLNRPQPGETVNRAAAAFRTGQYATRKEGAADKR